MRKTTDGDLTANGEPQLTGATRSPAQKRTNRLCRVARDLTISHEMSGLRDVRAVSKISGHLAGRPAQVRAPLGIRAGRERGDSSDPTHRTNDCPDFSGTQGALGVSLKSGHRRSRRRCTRRYLRPDMRSGEGGGEFSSEVVSCDSRSSSLPLNLAQARLVATTVYSIGGEVAG